METYFLKNDDLPGFYGRIAAQFELFLPVKAVSSVRVKCEHGVELPCDDYILKRYSEINKDEIIFSDYRTIEPLRAHFTYVKEEVCDYFSQNGKAPEEKPKAIGGVKNCDLFSLRIQDFVFLKGVAQDPAYKERRESALIISGDCPNFKEACFCRAFDIDPYAQEGFDFNFSPLNDGFLVDVSGERASAIADSLTNILAPATEAQLSSRRVKREAVARRMDNHLARHNIPGKEILQNIVVSGHNSDIWEDESKTCVECGGCVFMCDTCHCFLLSDQPDGDKMSRERTWDGCLFNNFSRVAGGANPLKRRYMRLRNRFLKKFDFFVANTGLQACCACGRCIEVCPGKIDIRKILTKLHDKKYLPTG